MKTGIPFIRKVVEGKYINWHAQHYFDLSDLDRFQPEQRLAFLKRYCKNIHPPAIVVLPKEEIERLLFPFIFEKNSEVVSLIKLYDEKIEELKRHKRRIKV